ncbi:glycosyltransferase [Silvanigrella paludirubra]|jgi:glycosyltransferase involved in cell wall biosynthesis|uniref:Glycosyltransferase n=1 Tax=Silvanigrella paludirubra TaxID=2499159 RepID=A0A6N6VRX3_9BACT|nr:glycosyltransferase [Silvanigrella paludirubra]KAB8038872.1 glycosyltransferase [Silvanigrella paludirubra]
MTSQLTLLEEANFKDNSDIVWLAIDSRSAQSGVVSGISRFVIGLTRALAAELDNRKIVFTKNKKRLKILIVSKSEPAQWVLELVHKYPNIVSFWSGGPGALQKSYDKPIWLWPTFALKRIQKLTNNQVIWFAPANFDRPLFVSRNNMSSRVIQVVHDSIPFMPVKGVGFIFKRQFRFLVKRALSRLPFVTTVSTHSAKILQGLVKKRTAPLYVIGDAVDLHFGSKSRITDNNLLFSLRKKFLDEVTFEKDSEKFTLFIEKIIQGNWVLGVGRNQKYKCWDIASQAVMKVATDSSLNVWFIRIGADQKEISGYLKKCVPKEIGKIKFFENLKTIIFPILSDFELAELYRLSSLLVHPSVAEGFGLPPLEAALSGTPVIYRTSTAVDQHFSPGMLPSNFWCGLDNGYLAIWAKQIEKMLIDNKDSEFYINLNKAKSTREFIVEKAQGKSFEWNESAISLLDWLLSDAGIINKFNKKALNAAFSEVKK